MQAMDNISSEDIEKMQLKPFVSLTVESLLEAYKANTFLLPIVPVMATTPELKSIYDTYLNTVHGLFMGVFEISPEGPVNPNSIGGGGGKHIY